MSRAHRLMLIAVAALLPLALLACAKPDPLPAEEVRALFSGKTVEGEHQVHGYSFKSYYDPSGTFLSIRDGVKPPLLGHWRVIESGEICIRWDGEEAEQCRHMVLHSHDRYVKVLFKSNGKRIPIVRYRSFVAGKADDFL